MSFRNQLKAQAKRAIRDVKAGKPSTHTAQALEIMEEEPDAVLQVIELIGAEAVRKQPDDAVLAVYGMMLSHGLELLRYQSELGYNWADAMIDDARSAVLAFASSGAVGPDLLLVLVNSFVAADIELGDELTDSFGEIAVEEDLSHPPPSPAEVDGMFESLVEQAGGDAFEICSSLTEATRAMPPKLRQPLMTAIATHGNPVLKDTAVLCVLDPAPEVRRDLYAALAENASRSLLSPAGLRRLIALRNWLPEGERPRVDAVVKSARQKQVDCASWPKRDLEEILVSNIDGAGAQSVFAVVKDGRKQVMANLLVKSGVGIADAWCARDQSKADVKRLLNTVRAETDVIAVGKDFLNTLGPHYLAVGQRSGHLPNAGVLEFLEAVGIEGWQPKELGADDLVALMEPHADAQADQATVEDILANSAGLFDEFAFMESWFEYDAEVETVLAKNPGSKGEDKLKAVIKSILEPRRGKWADRLLWTALWMKEAPDLPAPWVRFFVVGRELHRGRPLRDIPLMQGIAAATVAVGMDDSD